MLTLIGTGGSTARIDSTVVAIGIVAFIIIGAIVIGLIIRSMGALTVKRVLLAVVLGGALSAPIRERDTETIVGVFGQGMDRYAIPLIDATLTPKEEAPASAIALPDFEPTSQPRPPSVIVSQWLTYLFRNLPFASLLAIVITWALMAMISVLLVTVDETGLRWGVGARRLGGFSVQTRGRVVIGLLFGLSMYLSLAALVAFPWFKEESAPAGLSPDALKNALQEAVPPESGAAAAPTLAWSTPMRLIEDLLKPESGPQSLDPSLTAFCRAELMRADELRNDLTVRLEALREHVHEAKDQARRAAQQQYTVTAELHMTGQERTMFFGRVVDWHRGRVTRLEQRLRTATLAGNKLDARLRTWSTRVAREVRRVRAVQPESLRAKETRDAWSASEVAWFRSTGPGGLGQEYEELFDIGSSGDDRIRLPGPGDEFGPFGLVANWLLRTRSEALAILTGMLGFGLFGALIARFVRRRSLSDMWTSGEWPMVIVQGFSAALVVFLAVQGGINVFSTGRQDVNPYTLCLACLIGAVFSERVWAWARDRVSAIGRRPVEEGGAARAES